MDIFIQQIINGLVLGSVYALVALGYTMVYGIINLINFAHGEVLMVGAALGIAYLVIVWSGRRNQDEDEDLEEDDVSDAGPPEAKSDQKPSQRS